MSKSYPNSKKTTRKTRSGCRLCLPSIATHILRGRYTKEEGQEYSSDTALLLAKASDKITMHVFKMNYAKMEMLLWLSESRDLDQTNEELMGSRQVMQLSTTSSSNSKNARRRLKSWRLQKRPPTPEQKLKPRLRQRLRPKPR